MTHTLRHFSQSPRGGIRLGWTVIGACLAVAACNGADGAPTAQTRRAITTQVDLSIRVLGKCLDVPGWNDANGTAIQLYDCHGGKNQQWEFWSDGTVRPTFNTNKCLDLPGYQTGNGTPIQIYDCNGGGNQQWTLWRNGNFQGWGGKCIDVPGFQTNNGTNLQYYDCSSTPNQTNQTFALAPPVRSPSVFWNLKAEIENTGSNQQMCMGIAGGAPGGNVQPGRQIIVWNCNGSADQMWIRSFQTDPTAQSGIVNFVNGVTSSSSNGQSYPVCFSPLEYVSSGQPPPAISAGNPLSDLACPQYGGPDADEGFVLNYVQNDPFGYPCFTIQNQSSGLYVGVANAQRNPVQNGMSVILWDRTSSPDQVWCDHSANTAPSFTVTPQFVVTNVIYAPPGKSSNMQYSDTTTVGSSVTNTSSFQNSTDVTAAVSVGPMKDSSLAGDSASVTANRTFGDTDAHQVDLATTWTQGLKVNGEVNGINHDWDQIWLVVNPNMDVSFTPGIAGAPPITNWHFSQGDGQTTDITGFVYAGELNGDMGMSAQTQNFLDVAGITADKYSELLQNDAFFQGVAPIPGVNTDRFDYIGEFPYQPPPAPLGQGQMPSTQTYGVTQSMTTSDTQTHSSSYSVKVTISGGFDFADIFRAQFTVADTMTWTHSSSHKDSSGNGSMDQLVVGQPDFGYPGPGLLHVYEDRVFKTYAFTLDYAGAVPFSYDGADGQPEQCYVAGVIMHCCPRGNAMVGVQLDQDVFKCAPLADPTGQIIADQFTHRSVAKPNSDGTSSWYSMHTCPFGYVMIGLLADSDILACQQIAANSISDAITGELVDTGTQDSYPMRTCESTPHSYAMSGLDPANNLLSCATNPGLK